MQPLPYETVPLNDDDKDTLTTIYNVRRRLLTGAFSTMMLLAIPCAYLGLDYRMQRTPGNINNRIRHWEDTDNKEAQRISRSEMYVINLCWLESILIAPCIFLYFKRVHPYRKDTLSGIKQRIPYSIVQKKYFPVTNQYYVAFSDENYSHEQVDESTYNQCNEGDVLYMYRAIKSKYIFRKDGMFTVM